MRINLTSLANTTPLTFPHMTHQQRGCRSITTREKANKGERVHYGGIADDNMDRGSYKTAQRTERIEIDLPMLEHLASANESLYQMSTLGNRKREHI